MLRLYILIILRDSIVTLQEFIKRE